ncbi:MAG: phosphatidate cytidylyltransferase [Bacteroidales bacterium]|nr:phosphatidate cytidylyltransferase [Bacteroidales bacterium]
MTELAKRTIFGSLFVIVVIGSILLNYWAFFAVMLVAVVIGSKEVGKLMLKEEKSSLMPWIMILPTLFYAMSVIFFAFDFIIRFLFILTPLLVALFSKNYPFEKVVVSLWTAMFFVAFPCILMMEIHRVPLAYVEGKYLIIILFCLIWINDIFAYLTGMAIGKHKLFERISPKKTIEGSLGGLVMTVLAAYLVNHYWLHMMSDLKMMGMAIVVVVFGSLGDLCESMMKRQAGVKDSGNVIPGHGGILDRFDATFLAVPFVYCYLMLCYFGSIMLMLK